MKFFLDFVKIELHRYRDECNYAGGEFNGIERFLGFEVQSRHVRMSLFDGKQILSNVHTIRAVFDNKTPKTWKFLEKISDDQSIAEHADFFVRSNYPSRGVVLLLEVSMTFYRPNSDQRGELSCGWATLPLLSQDGTKQPVTANTDFSYGSQCLPNKNYTLILKTGSPFESGIGPDGQQGNYLSMSTKPKDPPEIRLKVYSPSDLQIEQIDGLSDVLIWNSALAPYAYWYRRIAGEVLIRDRPDAQNAELIPDPFLATFPYAAQEPDLMDVLRIIFTAKEKNLKKDEKTEEGRAQFFRRTFLESAGVLYNTMKLPPYSLLHKDSLTIRKETFKAFLVSFNNHKSPIKWLSGADSPNVKFASLDIFDLALNLVGPHSLD